MLDDYLDMVQAAQTGPFLGPDFDLTIFNRNLASVDAAAAALKDFEILCLMRERMALPKALIVPAPNLKTGHHNRREESLHRRGSVQGPWNRSVRNA